MVETVTTLAVDSRKATELYQMLVDALGDEHRAELRIRLLVYRAMRDEVA